MCSGRFKETAAPPKAKREDPKRNAFWLSFAEPASVRAVNLPEKGICAETRHDTASAQQLGRQDVPQQFA
jgi:hypothetical protein